MAGRSGVLIFVEVKKRQTLEEAIACLSATQSRRLYRAAECLLQRNAAWRYETLRFDLMAMDGAGSMEWIEDILRQM